MSYFSSSLRLKHCTLSTREAMAMAVRLLVLLNTFVRVSPVYLGSETEHQRSTTCHQTQWSQGEPKTWQDYKGYLLLSNINTQLCTIVRPTPKVVLEHFLDTLKPRGHGSLNLNWLGWFLPHVLSKCRRNLVSIYVCWLGDDWPPRPLIVVIWWGLSLDMRVAWRIRPDCIGYLANKHISSLLNFMLGLLLLHW